MLLRHDHATCALPCLGQPPEVEVAAPAGEQLGVQECTPAERPCRHQCGGKQQRQSDGRRAPEEGGDEQGQQDVQP